MKIIDKVLSHFGGTPARKRAAHLCKELEMARAGRYASFDRDLKELPVVKAILDAAPEVQAALVLLVVEQLAALRERLGPPQAGFDSHYANLNHEDDFPSAGVEVITRLLRRKLPFTDPDCCRLLNRTAHLEMISTVLSHLGSLLGMVERHVEANGLSDPLGAELRRVDRALAWDNRAAETRLRERIAPLLAGPQPSPVLAGEAWSDAARTALDGLDAAGRRACIDLLLHCQAASGGKPSPQWLKRSRELVDALEMSRFRSWMLEWFPLVDKPRTDAMPQWTNWRTDPSRLIIGPHADILKGLVWCCGMLEDGEIARAVTALAVSAYKKVPGVGPRAVKVGNACVCALGAMTGMDAVGQLALLQVKIKFRTAQKEIEKALNTAASRLGIPREELEEMGVPAYGLTEVGCLDEAIGEYTAQLRVTGTGTTELLWIKGDGKGQKSIPAAVKKDFADDLKDIQSAAKDIQKMLPAQRERLDGMYLRRKTWPYQTWKERYLDHPLVGVLARRLIWRFATGATRQDGFFLDGQIVDANDNPLNGPGADTTVDLWHPIDQPLEQVMAWREWLDRHQVQQPFKQAHREVYILTDAERQTGTYSNRYAAHIVKQHQFNALCGARGWRNVLKLMVDQEFPPAWRELPAWSLRAEFWTDGAGDNYGTDTNEAGTFHYLATDQVRFFPLEAPQATGHAFNVGQAATAAPVPLEQVPPLVFSEILRDADLFVGVASVGNDPTWSDGGPEGRYRDYWNRFSFGDLSAMAQTRKDVLKRLIPRLKIAPRCSIGDKFLIVRGDIRTYRIHLGSANILMEPNDQYLCIVPSRGTAGGAAENLFLPFEGDQTMSIILSKAFLLAEDTRIKDPTITQQINLHGTPL